MGLVDSMISLGTDMSAAMTKLNDIVANKKDIKGNVVDTNTSAGGQALNAAVMNQQQIYDQLKQLQEKLLKAMESANQFPRAQ